MLLSDKEEIEMGLRKKRGRPVTGRAKNSMKTVRLDDETVSKLDDILEEFDVSFSEYLRDTIRKDWEDRFIRKK